MKPAYQELVFFLRFSSHDLPPCYFNMNIGMALVKARTTIFSVLSTVYTAVTFHELFKEAAMDANRRLDFGVEWQEIFNILQGQCDVDGFDDKYLREKFDAIDDDGSGELDEGEMRALFESMGRPVSKRVVANIMRLSDTDGNGMFFLNEFHHLLCNLHSNI